jgi:hypothetical protein
MYNLNDNFLLWIPSVILEQMSPKMPRKNCHFNLYVSSSYADLKIARHMSSQCWAMTVLGTKIPPPVHVSCTWLFLRPTWHEHVLSMYNCQLTLLPVCIVSCPRPLGPLTFHQKAFQWRALTTSYLTMQPGVQNASLVSRFWTLSLPT